MSTRKKSVKRLLVDGRLRCFRPDSDKSDRERIIKKLRLEGHDVKLVKGNPPSIRTMENWMTNGVARTTDGCKTEPDGSCVHGHQSWMIVLGCI